MNNENTIQRQKSLETALLTEDLPSATPGAIRTMQSFSNLKSISKRVSIWEQLPDREIKMNEPPQNFRNNKINTSKYTFWTFIPKNFIEQFSKLANVYFLIIGFLQMIHEISASGGVPVIFFPLIVIIIVSGVKDLFEDLKRKKSDNQENKGKVLLLEKGVFKEEICENLQVGKIVKIRENDFFPADILLLKTSDSKNICYIETKNLDGETNLKRKSVAKDLDYIQKLTDLEVYFIFVIEKKIKIFFKKVFEA